MVEPHYVSLRRFFRVVAPAPIDFPLSTSTRDPVPMTARISKLYTDLFPFCAVIFPRLSLDSRTIEPFVNAVTTALSANYIIFARKMQETQAAFTVLTFEDSVDIHVGYF